MSSPLPALNPTGYLGTNATNPGQTYFRRRAPLTTDFRMYSLGDRWVDYLHETAWTMVGKTASSGTWQGSSSASVFTWQTAITSPTAVTVNSCWATGVVGANIFTLPSTAPLGSYVWIQGVVGSWIVAAAAGQTIVVDSTHSSSVGGTALSSDANDGIFLVCLVADTTWVATQVKGNIYLT